MVIHLLPQVFELVDILSPSLGASIEVTVNDGSGLKTVAFMQVNDLENVTPMSDPDSAKIVRGLYIANMYAEAEMPDRALERYKQVLELDETNSQAIMGAAEVLGDLGRTQEARRYWKGMGFAPENAWYVIGPFENDLGAGFDAQYPPEAAIELDAEYEIVPEAVKARWEKVTDGTEDGYVDFQEIFDPDQLTVAYAWTKVIAEEAGEVQLRTGSDDQIKVWLNGKEVISYAELRGAQPDQDIATVTLNEGENQILVKVCNDEMGWGFYLRITQNDGGALEGLRFSD